MKALSLALSLSLYYAIAFCQSAPGSVEQAVFEKLQSQRLRSDDFRQAPNYALPLVQNASIGAMRPAIPPTQLLQPPSAKKKPDSRANKTGSGKNGSGVPNRVADALCKDTSYTRLLSVANRQIYVATSTAVTGGILICGASYDTTLPGPDRMPNGLLTKIDEAGNLLWVKHFQSISPGKYSLAWLNAAFELSNGDIICTGTLDTSGVGPSSSTIVYRLTANGDIIWKNYLQTNIGIFNSKPGTFTFTASCATDGLNGDVIICGTSNSGLSSGHIETVVRLNNTGQLVWDANYGNHGIDGSYLFGAEGLSVIMRNGNIVLVGITHGTNNPMISPAVNFLTLDYASGNLLSKRFFRSVYPDALQEFYKSFSFYYSGVTALTNGHYLVYGSLLSDFAVYGSPIDHFGIMEFDAGFNLVDAYTIGSAKKTNYYGNIIRIDKTGKGLFSTFDYSPSYLSAEVTFVSFRDKQFLQQRQVLSDETALSGARGFTRLTDDGNALVQNINQITPTHKSFIEFRKMHDSDTSSVCLGTKIARFQFLPWNVVEDPGYRYLDDNEPNKMVTLLYSVGPSVPSATVSDPYACKQTNYCDTLKIHGEAFICGTAGSMIFTSFKNAACGGTVQWKLDKTAFDSLRILSDTSVQVWFKNINWQGQLYASLPQTACAVSGTDSLRLAIIRSPEKINLGRDTVLCSQRNLVLHAGNKFTSYLWQDASTDSLLTVTAPGMYWVKAADACGNSFADTIVVNAYNVSINIGPDRTKCNADTVRLNGPPGFSLYEWSDNLGGSGHTQQYIVNPAADAIYYLRTEQSPGCYAYDTVQVKVNTSPPVQLGADKNFCAGDSAILDAGAGFARYLWSNNDTTRTVTVYTAGLYNVKATAPNGCTSFDTLRIISVWPKPVVSLNKDSALCTGVSRVLNAGIFASYQWQDGSIMPSFTATKTGTYYVTVEDINHCMGSDTVAITKLRPLPAGFLPADTAVCLYGSIDLFPHSTYSKYAWNTGQTTPSVKIERPGTYWLQVTDEWGCSGIDSVIVASKECLKGFYAPTAFTPNTDGRNDAFRPLVFGTVIEFRLMVYNRFGQLIFQSSDPLKGWDGTVKGMRQDMGSFAWVCTYRLQGETSNTRSGVVTLLR